MSSEHEGGFTSEGHKPFPSLYVDNSQVGEFSVWSSGALHQRVQQYTEFILDSDLPAHRSIAARIINHALFELDYRERR